MGKKTSGGEKSGTTKRRRGRPKLTKHSDAMLSDSELEEQSALHSAKEILLKDKQKLVEPTSPPTSVPTPAINATGESQKQNPVLKSGE